MSDEVVEKKEELEKVESARLVATAKVAALEYSIRVLRSERVNDMETTTLREARLGERLGGGERGLKPQ